MSEEHDNYRPSSPDLSGFAPPPSLNRIPSYHAPDSSFPPGYSFSPRGSYDASPFFSPQTTTPTSYFPNRSQPSSIAQASSPPAFNRHPSLPTQTSSINSSAYQLSGQFHPQSIHQEQPQ